MVARVERKVIKHRKPSGPRKHIKKKHYFIYMCVFCGMILKRKASPCCCCCVDFDVGRVVSLNDDVLMEILVRLPVKSLTRFQSVCKWWLSLISGDQFRRLHTLRRHKPPPSLLLVTRESELIPRMALFYFNPIIRRGERLLSLIPFSIADKSIILSSSNGLMLLHCLADNGYYVYNPITKESKKLSDLAYYNFIDESLHLLFDPSKSLHYEIVYVRAEKGSRLRIQVFNSEIGIWRVCEELIAMPTGRKKFSSCVRYKRLIFWTCSFGRIICFDTVKNTWHIVDCAVRHYHVDNYSHSLQESNGRLYYCTFLRGDLFAPSAALWEVQVEEDDPRRSEWLLKYDHRLKNSRSDLLIFIAETSTLLIHTPGKIVAYNFRDQSYKELLHLEPHIFSVNAHHFGETLAAL
ncbi:hypothetical protein ACS0TY_000337 [Phlomoides rotata]